MQKPMTPILPVQPSCCVNQERTASISSKDLPRRARQSRAMDRKHLIFAPESFAREPISLISQVWFHSTDVMDYHDPRPWATPRSSGLAT
jgi:hypothetical protein